MTEKSDKFSIDKTHSWSNNHCIKCGAYREKQKHPNNSDWTLFVYYDKQTGEQTRSLKCKTNQLLLL